MFLNKHKKMSMSILSITKEFVSLNDIEMAYQIKA